MNKPLHKILIFSAAVLMALSVGAGTSNVTVSASHHTRTHRGIHHHNHKRHSHRRSNYYKNGFEDGKDDMGMAASISDTMNYDLLHTLLHNHNNKQYIKGVSAGLRYERRKTTPNPMNGNPFKDFKYDVNIVKFIYHQRGKVAKKAAKDCANNFVSKKYRHNKTYRRVWNATNHKLNKYLIIYGHGNNGSTSFKAALENE